jgi:hypothetical protein
MEKVPGTFFPSEPIAAVLVSEVREVPGTFSGHNALSALTGNCISQYHYNHASRFTQTESTSMNHSHSTPWIFWPFVAIWRLIALILQMTGRLIGIVLGLVLLFVGIILTLTVIGAIVGIPLAALGFLLIVRGLF